jgi:pimeloyl-ACP methyl ester carboxylesterase
MKLNKILYITFCLLTINSYAIGTYTTVESGVTLYSEYYPNQKAKFKGTIIFENGSGVTTDEWTQNKQFLTCAKKSGALFMYDRNGLGKSPADLHTSVSNPITAELVNNKLIKLLQQKHIRPPYLLVGHSYGGLYVDYFARKYPGLVQGVLMIDPSPRDFQYSDQVLSIVNIESWAKIPNKELYAKYSDANAKKLHMNTAAAIYYQFKGFEQTKQQIKELPPLSDKIPLILLSSAKMESADAIKGSWLQKQKPYLNQNPRSKNIIVDSGHFIQLEKPDLVCKQIKDLLK